MTGVIRRGRALIGGFAWWVALVGALAAPPLAFAAWKLAPAAGALAILLVVLGGLSWGGWFLCRRRRLRVASAVAFLLGCLFYGCAIAVIARALDVPLVGPWR